MGEGAWGFDFPTEARTWQVLREGNSGSAGGFIGDVLGLGYANAAMFLHDKVNRDLSQRTLTERARYEVGTLIHSMYG
jgi:hypothetical protein